jgi:hypothetical protein
VRAGDNDGKDHNRRGQSDYRRAQSDGDCGGFDSPRDETCADKPGNTR